MRRGLMAWDENELPRSVLMQRIEGLRAVMTRDGLDGFILYTNLVQPGAVTYLTGFTPYWTDALLLVPKTGAPIFATALSKRVANWISSTNPLSEIVNTPKPGAAVGARLAADGCRRVGVLELDRLPGGLYDEITGAAPTVALTDGSAAFASLRRRIDPAERGLLAHADALAVSALAQVDPDQTADAGAVAGLVEKQARLRGAEEAYIAVAADLAADRRMIRVSGPLLLAGRFALRASIAYKGSWVRRVVTIDRDLTAARTEAAAVAFAEAVAHLPSDRALSQFKSFVVEGCRLSQPLEALMGSRVAEPHPPAAGAIVSVQACIETDGQPILLGAPALLGAPGEAASAFV